MIEVTRSVKPQDLFGSFGRHYLVAGVSEFIPINDTSELLEQKANASGLEISPLHVADVETLLLFQKPGAKIGEQKLILHKLPDGTLWVGDDQVFAYETISSAEFGKKERG